MSQVSVVQPSSPQASERWFRRVINKLLVALALLYLLGTVLGGIGLGWIALHPPRHPITPLEERNVMAAARIESADISDVELVTTEGVTLRAWFMRPQEANGNVVMLLHGVSDNRLGMYGYGRWLNKNHYAVLLPDARGHGAATGKRVGSRQP
jgi:pimeloyl-ACP methyl ester carboxylesterase